MSPVVAVGPSILPARAELSAGDVRALYLLWLLGVQVRRASR